MFKKFSLEILLGIGFTTFMVSSYMVKQNEVTTARLEIPKISLEIKQLKKELRAAEFELDQFENPDRLLELAKRDEFCHLKFPKYCEIVKANETPLEEESPQHPRSPLIVGSIQ